MKKTPKVLSHKSGDSTITFKIFVVCHLLADFLESIKKDYEKAAKVYRNNCDEFHYAKSCLKFGTYSLLGKGLPKSDFTSAYNYFEKGCNLNDPESCLNQGLLLVTNNNDKGVNQDILKVNYTCLK